MVHHQLREEITQLTSALEYVEKRLKGDTIQS
jgi:hypothetical protein